jgi:ABC-2 type transport system permease protein
MMFSGFLYEISSMPLPLRIVSQIVAARYYVDSLRTVFLVGDVWRVIIPNIGFMLAIGAAFFALAWRNSSKTLDGK